MEKEKQLKINAGVKIKELREAIQKESGELEKKK